MMEGHRAILNGTFHGFKDLSLPLPPSVLRGALLKIQRIRTKKWKKKELILADIMTTRELAGYLKLHEITICKYAANGQIPAIRIGRVWRFDKEAIDEWIIRGQRQTQETNR